VLFGFCGSWCYATANTISSIKVATYGPKAVSAFWLACLILSSLGHTLNWKFNLEKDSGWKIYTYIDDRGKRRLWKMKLLQPFIRGFISCGMIINSNVCYYFFQLSGSNMNCGIISALFTTSIVYTTILFYCVYHQKVSGIQLGGILMIIMSVLVISFGKQKPAEFEDTETVNELYFSLAILGGLGVGMCMTLSMMTLQLQLKFYKFPPYQLTYDAIFCSSFIYGGIFILDTYKNGLLFTVEDFFIMNIVYFFSAGAMTFQALGLKNGLAGVVSALENMKVTWQTIMLIVISGGEQMPSESQFLGMASGVAGAMIIALNKPKPGTQKEEEER
jgi:drug/metabolite transporter (DMT)-like permease